MLNDALDHQGSSVSVGKGHTAVRASKRPRLSDGQPWQRHELFPTPPWATRALVLKVLPMLGVAVPLGIVLEPAAGLGHMSEVLRESADHVCAADIHFYDCGIDLPSVMPIDQRDFLTGPTIENVDWVITNPPFGLAERFLVRALTHAARGIALLMRTQWFETEGRFTRVYSENPPTLVAQFAERIAMCEGGWDPQCSTATAYAWFVWLRSDGRWQPPSRFAEGHARGAILLDTMLIPPGQKRALSRPGDARLAARSVPGFVPPSSLRRTGKLQQRMAGL